MLRVLPLALVRVVPPRLDLSLSRRQALRVALASTLAPTRSRTDGALVPSCGLGGAWPCTDGALPGGGRSPGRLARESWCCGVELSAFCTMACSRSLRSPWHTLLPSGVDGSGIALRSSAAAITFWLAVLKRGGSYPPASSMMRRLTSRARCWAAPPSPRAEWSRSRILRSCHRRTCSSSSLASSSLSCSRSGH